MNEKGDSSGELVVNETLHRLTIKDGDLVAFEGKYGRGLALMADGNYYYCAYNLTKHYGLSMAKRITDDILFLTPSKEDIIRAKEKFGDFGKAKVMLGNMLKLQRDKGWKIMEVKIKRQNSRLNKIKTEEAFVKLLIQTTKKIFKNDISKLDGIRLLMMMLGREDEATEIDELIEKQKAHITINTDKMNVKGNVTAHHLNDIHNNNKVILDKDGSKG